MKFAFKNAQVEEVNKEKQQKWKDWNSGINSGQKVGHFKTKYDMNVWDCQIVFLSELTFQKESKYF
jgi:hypothetical protein